MKGFTVSWRPSLPRIQFAYRRRGAIAPTMLVALVLAAIAALFVAVFFAQTRPAKEVDVAQAAGAESLYAEGLALQSSDPEVARAKFLESPQSSQRSRKRQMRPGSTTTKATRSSKRVALVARSRPTTRPIDACLAIAAFWRIWRRRARKFSA